MQTMNHMCKPPKQQHLCDGDDNNAPQQHADSVPHTTPFTAKPEHLYTEPNFQRNTLLIIEHRIECLLGLIIIPIPPYNRKNNLSKKKTEQTE